MQEIPTSSAAGTGSDAAPLPSAPDGRGAGAVDAVAATVWPWRQAEDSRDRSRREAEQRRAIRRTAAVRTVVGLLVATALAFWKPWLAVVVAALSLITLALALASPLGVHARLERGLERLGYLLGLGVTWLLMPLLYFLLFLPTGLVLRSGRKLRLTRGPEPERATYWERPHRSGGVEGGGDRWQGTGLDRYRRQF